jgi:hypothetical protein
MDIILFESDVRHDNPANSGRISIKIPKKSIVVLCSPIIKLLFSFQPVQGEGNVEQSLETFMHESNNESETVFGKPSVTNIENNSHSSGRVTAV